MAHVYLKSKYCDSPNARKGEIDFLKRNFYVYVLIYAKIPNLPSEIMFMDDYINYFQGCDHEKKIVSYIKVCFLKIFIS